jgi:hypothetical protein
VTGGVFTERARDAISGERRDTLSVNRKLVAVVVADVAG